MYTKKTTICLPLLSLLGTVLTVGACSIKKQDSTLSSSGIKISSKAIAYGFEENFLFDAFSAENVENESEPKEILAIVKADWRDSLPLKNRAGDYRKFRDLKKDDGITAIGSVGVESLSEFGSQFKVRSLVKDDTGQYEFLRLKIKDDRPEALITAINELSQLESVQLAEPNYKAKIHAIPNDMGFPSLWGMQKISAPLAWDITTGNPSVTVAVIDTGVDYLHSDLSANIWSNPNEVLNGLDDDGNGFVDDIRGWNFAGANNNPMDGNGHGTHVAGIIGAVGNNQQGVTGVGWNIKLMPVKIFSDANTATVADIINGVLYAANNGAHILNNSYSCGISVAMTNAVMHAREKNTLFVAAAGNNGLNDAVYPASLSLSVDSVISVASIEQTGALSSFSNFGRGVDIAAPGGQISSTYPNNLYASLSGTSMASPHVAGVGALLLSQSPTLTVTELKNAILSSATPSPELLERVPNGVLNARAALEKVMPVPPAPTPVPPAPTPLPPAPTPVPPAPTPVPPAPTPVPPTPQLKAGLRYEYFIARSPWTNIPNFNQLTPQKTGIISHFKTSVRTRNVHYGMRFRGVIQIARAGTYTFFTDSDDGSRLWINGKLIVNNGGLHTRRERSGKIALPAGKHNIRVDYFQSTKASKLLVKYRGPGILKSQIPARILFHN
ncbi:MAG: hypothetical protein RJB13_1824 [Pseudomonadota bacterium]